MCEYWQTSCELTVNIPQLITVSPIFYSLNTPKHPNHH
jgi:hypothetical protein